MPRLDALGQEGVRAQTDEAQKRGDVAVCHDGVLVVGKDLQDGVGDGGREPVELEVVQGVRASGACLDVGAGVLLDELADVGQKARDDDVVPVGENDGDQAALPETRP